MYKSFKEMPVWQEAMDVAVNIFKATENIPRTEDYGLTLLNKSFLSLFFLTNK